MIRRILVPLDRSQLAEDALGQALEIATRTGAILRLVHAWEPTLGLADGMLPSEFARQIDLDRAEARDYLGRIAAKLRRETGLVIEAAELELPVAESICADALASHVDLVVMSTHGRTGWSRLWLGSVADAVLRDATVPTLLVRPSETEMPTSPPPRARRILVPLDGSAGAEEILDPACDVFGVVQPVFVLLRVVAPLLVPAFAATGTPAVTAAPEATARREAEAHEYLLAVAERLRARRPGIQVDTSVAVDERPARAIVALAEDADFVAIVSRRRGASRLLLGSVTDKVLRATAASLLVLRLQPAPTEGVEPWSAAAAVARA